MVATKASRRLLAYPHHLYCVASIAAAGAAVTAKPKPTSNNNNNISTKYDEPRDKKAQPACNNAVIGRADR